MIMLVGSGVFAAIAFQDRLGFLGGGNSQPPPPVEDGSDQEEFVGGGDPTVLDQSSPEPTIIEPTDSASPSSTTLEDTSPDLASNSEDEVREAVEDYY